MLAEAVAAAGPSSACCTSSSPASARRSTTSWSVSSAAQTEPLRDPLTGLKNLNGLRRAVEARASGELTGVAFLAADIDYFKRINDTHGHVIGDKVLAKVAEILRGHLTERGYRRAPRRR